MKFAVNHQALHGIIGAGGGLFGQLLHAYQLFVNDAERAVGGLDKGNGVIGVVDALMQRGHVGPHELADGQPRGVVGRLIYAQSGGKAAYGVAEAGIMRGKMAIGGIRHKIVMQRKGHYCSLAQGMRAVGICRHSRKVAFFCSIGASFEVCRAFSV